MQQLLSVEQDDIRAPLEALLLVSPDSVTAGDLAKYLNATPEHVTESLLALSREYDEDSRGFCLREVAGGWRLYTQPAYHSIIEAYVQSWYSYKLTQAALETLAVIAYSQPATREDIRAIRGVNSDSAINSLAEKNLIKEVGKKPSGAVLYGTTKAFLEKFGLRSVSDLPPLDDFAPDEETKDLIRERLGSGFLEQFAPKPGEDTPGDSPAPSDESFDNFY